MGVKKIDGHEIHFTGEQADYALFTVLMTELRAAIGRREPRVQACLAGEDLTDMTESLLGGLPICLLHPTGFIPVAQPALWRQAQHSVRKGADDSSVDFLCDRSQVDDRAVAPLCGDVLYAQDGCLCADVHGS